MAQTVLEGGQLDVTSDAAGHHAIHRREQVAASLVRRRRQRRERAGRGRRHPFSAHDQRRSKTADDDLVRPLPSPLERSVRAIYREAKAVAMSGRCLRENAYALNAAVNYKFKQKSAKEDAQPERNLKHEAINAK